MSPNNTLILLGERHRARKNKVSDEIENRIKPQIALDQVERALSNEIRVFAWTFDELYGRDGGFLNGLETLWQTFVGEVPMDVVKTFGKLRPIRFS